MVDTRYNLQNIQKSRKNITVLLFFILIFSIFAIARTTTSQTGCNAEINVKLAFYGAGVNQTQISSWKQTAENLWNGPASSQAFGDCNCKLKFKFVPAIVGSRADCPADAHCIEVKKIIPPTGSHRDSVNTGGAPGTGFDNRPYTSQSTGTFSDKTNGLTVAHEIGHLMGLDDEYFEFDANYTVNADGTITLHNGAVTYPPGIAMTEAYGAKILEILGKRLSAGRISVNRLYNSHLDGLTPGSSNTSIMGQEPGMAWLPQEYHIKQMTEGRAITCPDKCCCGNGKIEYSKSEECDKNATPSGCPSRKPLCNQQCKCDGLPTTTTSSSSTTTLTEGVTTTLGGSVTGGDQDGITSTTPTSSSTTTTQKPKCETSSDCGELMTKRICKNGDVYEQKSTPLCRKPGTSEASCISKLKDNLLEDCGEGRCVNGQCISDEKGPSGCCDCPGESCYSGPTIFEEDCPQYCSPSSGTFKPAEACSQQTGNCYIPTTTSTTSTTQPETIITCEDQGQYATQNSCSLGCQAPDICQINELTDCWYCQQVTVTCNGDLYSSDNCDGQCSSCETCKQYEQSPCYYCDRIGQCINDNECGNYHSCSECQCVTDCSQYCSSVGQGFTNYPGISTSSSCASQGDSNSQLAQILGDLSEPCFATCGRGFFLDGISDSCCCIKTNKVGCYDCPGLNPDCTQALEQCKSSIPM